MSDVASRIRPARRSDVARLADLRLWYLAETARLEPRLKLSADARERIAQAVSVWVSQEDRVLVVAEGSGPVAGEGGAGGGDAADAPSLPLAGYATGLYSVWPPVLRAQRVGEVAECFVVPTARGAGLGRAMLDAVCADLAARGAEVLRAPVPTRNEWAAGVFRARGFEPHLRVLERAIGAK